MEADGFRDRNQRYGFLVARENARRILADPAVLEAGRRYLERFTAGDPHRRRGYALWSALLDEGAEAVSARLTERGARGDDARETAPSFGGLPGPVRARLLRAARSPLDPVLASGVGASRRRPVISRRPTSPTSSGRRLCRFRHTSDGRAGSSWVHLKRTG